jgi:hypothetical protein
MSRARELVTSGRSHEALQLLSEIDIADPLRAEADRLVADIQRGLLGAGAAPSAAATGETPR